MARRRRGKLHQQHRRARRAFRFALPDRAVRQRAARALRVGAGRHAEACGTSSAREVAPGGAWRLRPGRCRSLFRCRYDDSAYAGGSEVSPTGRAVVHDLFDVGPGAWAKGCARRGCLQAGAQGRHALHRLGRVAFSGRQRGVYTRFARASNGRRTAIGAARWIRDRTGPAEERSQFGETVYLLEPNVKRSPGGLRDMQLCAGWALPVMDSPIPIAAAESALFSNDYDHVSLRARLEFLLRVRNEMHFHAGKPQDCLGRSRASADRRGVRFSRAPRAVAGRRIHAGVFPA